MPSPAQLAQLTVAPSPLKTLLSARNMPGSSSITKMDLPLMLFMIFHFTPHK